MKAKEESYLENQELGMEIRYQLRERNFSSVLLALLVGNLLPTPSEGKGSHFYINQKTKMKDLVPGLVDPIETLQLTHLKTLLFRSIFH